MYPGFSGIPAHPYIQNESGIGELSANSPLIVIAIVYASVVVALTGVGDVPASAVIGSNDRQSIIVNNTASAFRALYFFKFFSSSIGF
jgi:hypothetical protein